MDEVQCGVGRTGKLFAHEWAGITPDIMMVAKGIGGGFPLGAVLATEEAASGMTAGTHGSTYGGNPLGCAVGCAVIDQVATPAFLESVNRKAGLLRQKLEGLIADHPDVFEEVRGSGLMLGLKCKPANIDVVNAGYDNEEVITVPAADNVIRLLPPLTLTEDDIAQAMIRLDKAAAADRSQPRNRLILHLFPNTPGVRGQRPRLTDSQKRNDMNHFLDIHKTDAPRSAGHDRSGRRDETGASGPSQSRAG